MRAPLIAALLVLWPLLVACSTSSPVLDKYPGAANQIISYYDQNATEDDWMCNDVSMGGIERAKIVRETPNEVVMAIQYGFDTEDGVRREGATCNGFGTRIFAFSKAGSGVALESMSGAQRSARP